MAADKYTALWVSHSSSGDFLRCPRQYYLRNVYKDPRTGHKITVMEPPLALGQVVHEVVESLSTLPVEDRFKVSPLKRLENSWEKISGEKGGFRNKGEEEENFEEARKMIQSVVDNPGPLKNKAIKIGQELPYYWLSEEENIILCGKIDWIEYLEETNSVHVIDFKTGKREEKANSLQLPIYRLLLTNTQKRPVEKASYWYLRQENGLRPQDLPEIDEAEERVMEVARRMKLSRQIRHFKCPTNGCRFCVSLERVVNGKGKKVGESEYGQDIYVLKD